MIEGTMTDAEIGESKLKAQEEMNRTKPEVEAKDPLFTKEKAINTAGNVMNSLGGMMALVGAVGASVYVLEGVMALVGMGLMATILSFMGGGVLLLFISQYMITDQWFQ